MADSSSSLSGWVPNPSILREVVELLEQVTASDSAVQSRVAEGFRRALELPDALCYFAAVLAADCGVSASADARQVAGLNVKNHMNCLVPKPLAESPADPIAGGFLLYIKQCLLKAIQDPQHVVRAAAGSGITRVFGVLGNWPEVLDILLNALDNANEDVVDGAFSTLCKICEDELLTGGGSLHTRVTSGGSTTTAPFTDSTLFTTFAHAKLLPKLFQFCSPSNAAVLSSSTTTLTTTTTKTTTPRIPPTAITPSTCCTTTLSSSCCAMQRRYALCCLSSFVQCQGFAPGAPFEAYFAEYWRALSYLAGDPSPDVRLHVVTGMIQMASFNPQFMLSSGEAVVSFMVEATGSSEYNIRLEALEFWPVVLRESPWKHVVAELIRPHLPKLVRSLIAGCEYSEQDYLQMDDSQLAEDNAAEPDRANDIEPRFHRTHQAEGRQEEEDEEDQKTTWGGAWTVRKGSALALDNLAVTYSEELLPEILPLIESSLASPRWELRECAVLSLGAIAQGCLYGLSPYLGKVLILLTELCDHPKPLLRSISCWCLSRFCYWICQPANSGESLKLVLATLLRRVLDRNKRVQEAACSAFATLEEEARDSLVPYLTDIVGTLAQAFQFYQAKNLLILFDAVGTLANSVNGALQHDDKVYGRLMEGLFSKWRTVPESSLVALFECINCCAHALEKVFFPYSTGVVERCCNIITVTLNELKQQSDVNCELMECSLDVLSGVCEALGDQTPLILGPIPSFMQLVQQCCRENRASILQSSFALVGDLTKNCRAILMPHLDEIIPILSANVQHPATSVSNNAGWAIGEICIRLPEYRLDRHIPSIAANLIGVLNKPQQHRSLLQNVCITLGRLGMRSELQMAPLQVEFLKAWCVIVQGVRNDHEKSTAFQGICALIMQFPEPASDCLPELCTAIVTFQQCPQPLEANLALVIKGLKQSYEVKWKTFWESAPPPLQEELRNRFRLDA